jgi:hypothetical protein
MREMHKEIALGIVTLGLCSGCATSPQPALLKETRSGRAEAMFVGETVQEVRAKIAGRCLDRGSNVIENSEAQVVCSKQTTGGAAIISQLAIGNAYSTTPDAKIRFNLVQLPDGVRVVAAAWIETQMAFGQVNTMEVNDVNTRNAIQTSLHELGGI